MDKKVGFIEFAQKSLSELKDKECRCAKTYLGSMFYIDFGKLINMVGRKGNIFQKGEASISIRDCYWEIWENATLTGCSNNNDLSFVLNIFVGKFVTKININDQYLIFGFDDSIELRCDLTNIYGDEPENSIIEVANNTLSINYYANAQGEFFIDSRTNNVQQPIQ
jgi:hypothetical protein